MNDLVLKILEGEPRVYLAPIGWISYEKWFFFPVDEWYHNVLEEIRNIEKVSKVCCEGEPPVAEKNQRLPLHYD